jgi:hypothetical protein
MIVKHISMLSVVVIIAASRVVSIGAIDVLEDKNLPGIASKVVAPHVPLDVSEYYIKPTLCKVIDISEPLHKQLKMCKEQRKGWFKI